MTSRENLLSRPVKVTIIGLVIHFLIFSSEFPVILFVTGAFVTHHCWNEWRTYFEKHGYTTVAPPWPFKDGTTKELRERQPHDTDPANLTLAGLVEHYAVIAKSFREKPIIIGHSLKELHEAA